MNVHSFKIKCIKCQWYQCSLLRWKSPNREQISHHVIEGPTSFSLILSTRETLLPSMLSTISCEYYYYNLKRKEERTIAKLRKGELTAFRKGSNQNMDFLQSIKHTITEISFCLFIFTFLITF